MKKEHEEFIIDDRIDMSMFDIFSEEEEDEFLKVFEQKEKEYDERAKNMTKEERSKAFEEHSAEISRILEQFRERTLKRQKNTATA